MSRKEINKFVNKIQHQLKTIAPRTNKSLKQWSSAEESKDYYGIVAPVESYMDVPLGKLSENFWDCVSVGDVVIGRVISKLERSLLLCLLCFDGGKSQDIESLEINARCPRSEIPALNNHEDPLSRFAINDLARGEVIGVHRREEQLVISFHGDSSSTRQLKLGLIGEESLPIGYKRMCASNESYDKLLQLTTGFYNPNVIEYLKGRLIPGNFTSLISDLQTYACPPGELAPALRKRQSAKVAARSVAKGINFYRKDMMLEALQELNLALDLDPANTDALVARGALYANKRTFAKAIADFEKALSIDHQNKNAKKYLVEVLIERARSIEQDMHDLVLVKEASSLYRRALALDPESSFAKTALGSLEKEERAQREKLRRGSSTDSASSDDRKNSHQKTEKTATILKVRQLLEHDVGISAKGKSSRKSRKQESTSSSSSSSTSSTSSGTSDSSSSSQTSSNSTESSPSRKRRRRSSTKKRRKENISKKRKKRVARSRSSSDSSCGGKTNVSSAARGRSRAVSSSRRSSEKSRRRSNDVAERKRKRSSGGSSSSRNDIKRSSIDFSTSKPSFRERRTSSASSTFNKACESEVRSKHVRTKDFEEPLKREGRLSTSSRGNDRERPDKTTKPDSVGKPDHSITKITKDNFTNILDQISKFEKQKCSK